ncbi:LacI family DNA-binding transcriptional regulator [Leuconostoc mesenteroides]|uniref:LacI family DNA-binding transcriptional regulator n=1 Tax=Leuconostoc mesenteroides TaxID=1245 RepID=UPI000A0466CC|nr:LacI family DNA-binding transcriptional regulator [Leuconostoc mesenteroides]MBZ1516337.1 LacI family DNA-binding transcriptional regulator [Leuconostoc mesenteroides]MBZ1541071.1 LacI family DNA-binding transcriptional regulator [Leuconostoc mesenteroides]ORI79727.1 LacI family transcriptional regulator [Leuconostoc mesenteroides subsp. mesenteroides]PAK80605.1 LacI family transcriptional regulator [Leuconostoc mesenteroides]HBO55591.1 LacI family DNA-binding transcriptional regulator [Leu
MVTIQDIANKTGVAISTVSRALGDSQKISLRTKERIREAARDMGYTPNFAARNLTQTESNTVGVVFQPQSEGNTDNDFAMQILFGINAQLIARRYLLTTATGSNWSEVFNAVKRMVEAGQVRRFILLYTVENDPIAELLRENHARVVVTGEPEVATNILYVDNDNRELGFREAQEEGDVLSLPLEFTQQKQALQKYFEQHQTVDGIVASDDKLGYLARNQAQAHLPSHPKLPTIAFNCSEYARLGGKNFYSVDVLPRTLGSEAVRLLFNDQQSPLEKTEASSVIVPYRIPKIGE